jgi:hypothetical protein
MRMAHLDVTNQRARKEGTMHVKKEGPLFAQVPLTRSPRGQLAVAGRQLRPIGLPRCEMCGSPVIANQCRRICLRCGFMTGYPEGI